MNKFLKQYPNLWIPQVGESVKIIKIYTRDMDRHVPYSRLDRICTVVRTEYGGVYVGKFNLTVTEHSLGNYSGICSIGYPLIHFVPYYDK
jgi:hypothetical protein